MVPSDDSPTDDPRGSRSRKRRSSSSTPDAAAGDSSGSVAASGPHESSGAEYHSARLVASWRFNAVAALGTAIILTCTPPFEYTCAATFRSTGSAGGLRLDHYQTEAFHFARQQDAGVMDNRGDPNGWFVESPGDGLFRLCLKTSHRRSGLERVAAMARSYLATMSAANAEARATPGQGEQFLLEYARDLETHLQVSEREFQNLAKELPAPDPQVARDSLSNRWRVLLAEYSAARMSLSEATAELKSLKRMPEPTRGDVAEDARRAAIDADVGLQQDLRELEVNLTELKVSLLNVWQESSEPLEGLVGAAEALVVTHASSDAPNERTQRKVGELISEGELYRQSAKRFAQTWNDQFADLANLSVDPFSGRIIEIHRAARALLGDFLFEGSRRLAAMRAVSQALGESIGDDARYHVLHSNLVRSFRVVQSLHRRLEFAAGTINAGNNYQLDAALRGARGLRRRTQQRIRLIDEKLQAEAVAKARRQRAEDIVRTEQNIAHLWATVDQGIEALIAAQKELNASTALTEEFLRGTVQTEVAKSRTQQAQATLVETRKRLADLESARRIELENAGIELVGCTVVAGPIDVMSRLRFAIPAALITFLALIGRQWWTLRTVRTQR